MKTNKEPALSASPGKACGPTVRSRSRKVDAPSVPISAHGPGDLACAIGDHAGATDLERIDGLVVDELEQLALLGLRSEKDRIAAFEIELRRATCASVAGSIDSELAHDLRGRLNAIVLQVEAIKQGPECRGESLARLVDSLELDLRRLGLSLKDFLERSASTIQIEEAFGRPN